MAIWLVRAGGHIEREQKSISESRVYFTWDDLAVDLSNPSDREAAYNLTSPRLFVVVWNWSKALPSGTEIGGQVR